MTNSNRPPSITALLSSWRLSPALSHPAWWVALAALVINDHVLKGSGWLPGWLTGKVSDFAFLLVAPALAHTFLPARLPGRRALALLAVAIPFILAKAFPVCTQLLESAVRVLGITWRLWTDPTDLVALAVLPVSIGLLAQRAPRRPDQRAGADLVSRTAVTLGALACVATSAVPGPQQVRPFVRNGAANTEQVQVQWLLKDVACTVPLSQITKDLQNGDFSQPTSLELVPEAFAALDMAPRSASSPVGVCSNDPLARRDMPVEEFCPVVLVQAAGLPAVLTRTSGYIAHGGVCTPNMWPEHRPAGEIRIESGSNGALHWVAGSYVEMSEFAIPATWSSPPPAGTCRAIASDYAQALQGGQDCTIDADCRPAGVDSCDAINTSAAPAVDAAVSAYSQAGCADLMAACEENHPAICDAGRCAVDCPTVRLYGCLAPCEPPVRVDDACDYMDRCLNDDGTICWCSQRDDGQAAIKCEPHVVQPGCRNWCLR